MHERDAFVNHAGKVGRVEQDGIIRGSGNDVTAPISLRTGLLVVGATHRGNAHFAVEVVGPEGTPRELLVNTLGFYAGGRAMPVRSGLHHIQIVASAEWELFVEQPSADGAVAPPTTHEGAGDLVLGPFRFSTRPSQATMTHRGTANFLMTLLALDGTHWSLLANEIGEYQGTTTMRLERDGVYFVDVRADGEWALSID